MNDKARPGEVMCCFCGQHLPLTDAHTLAIYERHGDGSQFLYAHRECLRRVVVAAVPLLSDGDQK